MTRDTRSTFEEKLRAVWIERNGTGTDACSTCRPPHICAWHEAMIDDIRDLIKSEVINVERDIYIKNTYPVFHSVEEYIEHIVKIRRQLRKELVAIVDGKDNT